MQLNNIPEEQHNIEIHQNLKSWQSKPVLRKIYADFYKLLASQVDQRISGKIVELGSGIGNLKMMIPEVVCTDIFDNPWIDQVENAYKLTFDDNSVSNLILFDVLHHLKYPGNAFDEFKRVLAENGRVIIFEPSVSLVGRLVYGVFHHEPLGLKEKITWSISNNSDLTKGEYYAAQGNAHRIFYKNDYKEFLSDWEIITVKRISSISYILSGGYSKRQMFPGVLFPVLKLVDRLFNTMPPIFSTRMLVVLKKI